VSKLDRLLLILNLLRCRRNLGASNLAKECDVSERTIYRDINAISSANIPVYFDKGYRLLTDAFLPPLNLTIDELLTIYLGLSSEPVQSVERLRKLAKQALVKLESSISKKTKADYDKIKQRITVQPGKKKFPKGEALILELLRQAIYQENKIKLRWVSSHSSGIIKLVPKVLVYKKGNWHLVGEIQKKTRCFRLDIIKSISLC
jgi:predicted DNA-binding transcriptional regulator YafY